MLGPERAKKLSYLFLRMFGVPKQGVVRSPKNLEPTEIPPKGRDLRNPFRAGGGELYALK